jgi:hypothetical protein
LATPYGYVLFSIDKIAFSEPWAEKDYLQEALDEIKILKGIVPNLFSLQKCKRR